MSGFDTMADFKIAAAQVPSTRGDIATNIVTHAATIAAAAKHGVRVLVFPELSLTGYEPDLAAELAITGMEKRLAPLSALARQHQIEVVLGAPLRADAAKPYLGAILLTARGESSEPTIPASRTACINLQIYTPLKVTFPPLTPSLAVPVQ
jgi:predicted amidohydrolase